MQSNVTTDMSRLIAQLIYVLPVQGMHLTLPIHALLKWQKLMYLPIVRMQRRLTRFDTFARDSGAIIGCKLLVSTSRIPSADQIAEQVWPGRIKGAVFSKVL
jgi:hypothetical protein